MSILKKREEVRYFEEKLKYTLGPTDLDRMIKSLAAVSVIDVRSAEDYAKGHIPGAVNLPEDRWDTLEGLIASNVNVVYCYSQQCHLAAKACLHFARRGYNVMELAGGWAAWKDYEMRVETGVTRKAA